MQNLIPILCLERNGLAVKISLINNGKLTNFGLNLVMLLGFAVMAGGYFFTSIHWLKIVVMSIGLAIAAISGYGAKVQAWGDKTFF
ncbi:hypothetical protein ACIPF8_01405 [Collimonas sp. NPDC087041]|uniref:hypothetical protein n=1 Tax=Collimonas sp. NPDC087041 TaxID=3363960 RepID=UPI003816698F